VNTHYIKYKDALPAGIKDRKGFNPAKTSMKQIARGIRLYSEIINKFDIQPKGDIMRNLDYGGGLYNYGKTEFRKQNIYSQVYDIYSRSFVHNEKVAGIFNKNKPDTVTLFNVLNVIQKEEQIKVIKKAWNFVKKNGALMVQIYKAPNKGLSKSGTWQEGKALQEYIMLIAKLINTDYQIYKNIVILKKG